MAEQESKKETQLTSPRNIGSTLFVLAGLSGCLLVCLPFMLVSGYVSLHPEFWEQLDKGEDPANAKFAKADLHKIEAGMTLDEVNKTLGSSKAATPDDMVRAFGDAGGGQAAAARWQANGNAAGVTAWHQWQAGDDSIFVGFAKGKRTGKELVLTSFWVQRRPNGFVSDFGLLPVPNDPDVLAEERDKRLKHLNDPKFKAGDAKKLVVGRWYDEVKNGYEFKADGSYTRLRDAPYGSVYRFTAADVIELTIPAGAIFVGGKESKESHKLWVSEEELILQQAPGQLQLKYKRDK